MNKTKLLPLEMWVLGVEWGDTINQKRSRTLDLDAVSSSPAQSSLKNKKQKSKNKIRKGLETDDAEKQAGPLYSSDRAALLGLRSWGDQQLQGWGGGAPLQLST